MTNHRSPQRDAQELSATFNAAERASNLPRFFEFHQFRIDTKRRLLMRDGQPVAIKAKALDTLTLLVEHAGQLLEKEELMNRLWPDTAVEEANLTQNIFEVRKALGEVSGEQRFIVTVARRGYRFVAEVRAICDGAGSDHVAGRNWLTVAPIWGERVARRPAILAAAAITIALPLLATAFCLALRHPSPIAAGTPPSTRRDLTRLTYGAGLQTDIAWSPDGRRVAYAWNREENFDIWVQSIDGGEPARVTSSPADERQPAWAPNGQRLVFRSEADGGGLFTVDLQGGPMRRIAPYGRRPAWMPDGRDVVFMDSDSPRAAYLVSGEGGEAPRPVLESELSRTIWAASAIHPQGRISVISPGKNTPGGVFFVANRTNSRLTAVDASAAVPFGLLESNTVRKLTWNASGTALIVEAFSDGVPTLWRVPVDPVSLRWHTPERLTSAPVAAESSAVSPDGTRVAFTSTQASTGAWLFQFDADRSQLLDNGRRLTHEDLTLVSHSLAPDGTAFCYTARETGRNGIRLFHIDLTTGRTMFLAEAREAAISQTGRSVAYLLTRTGSIGAADKTSTSREWALAVRELDGRERLVSRWLRGGLLPGDWAPDDKGILGSWVEFGYPGQSALAIWPTGSPMATRPERVLLESSGVNFWQTRYSPDHRWVSFVAQRMLNPGTVEIGIVAERSDRAKTWAQISKDHVWPDKPRWSPDGRTLYFLSRGSDGYFNVWGVPIDSNRGVQAGAAFQVTHFSSPDWHIDPDMSSIGMDVARDKLVLPMLRVKGSIWILSGVRP